MAQISGLADGALDLDQRPPGQGEVVAKSASATAAVEAKAAQIATAAKRASLMPSNFFMIR